MKQLASPLVAHVSGGSAPRCPHHRRGRCKQGSLGISWSEEQAGQYFHLENLTDCQKRGAGHSWKGCVVWWGGACAAGGGVRCRPRAGNHFRYVQKIGLGQNSLCFHGADFYSVFSCVEWWTCVVFFFSPLPIKPQVNSVSQLWSWLVSLFPLHPCISVELEEKWQPCIIPCFQKCSQF